MNDATTVWNSGVSVSESSSSGKSRLMPPASWLTALLWTKYLCSSRWRFSGVPVKREKRRRRKVPLMYGSTGRLSKKGAKRSGWSADSIWSL